MLDQAFDALKTYDWGTDPNTLNAINDAVIATYGNEATRKELEARLAAVLKTEVSRDAKDFVCRKLMVVGTAASVPTLAELLPDKDLSHMARYALEPNPAPEAAQAIRDALPKVSGALKVGMISSLGARKDAAGVPALAALLTDSDVAVARAAAFALGEIRTPDAAKALASAKPNAEAKSADIDASLCCADALLANGKKTEALALYKSLAGEDQAKHVRFAANRGMLACLGKKSAVQTSHLWFRELVLAVAVCGIAVNLPAAGENDELVQMVVTLMADKDKDLRAVALEQVRTEAKGPEATKQFAALLPKLPPDAQVALLSALADRGDAAARPAVVRLLSATPAASVRIAAIGALGPLGEPSDTPQLVKSLSSESKPERAAARTSLVRLSGEAVPSALVAELKQAAAPTQVAILEILTTRRALDSIPDILPIAVAADPVVRAAAMTALGELAGPEHIADMIPGVQRAEKGKPRDAAERSVALVCSRISDQEKRADPLLAAMDKLNATDRTAMLPTLGRVGGAAALKVVETAIGDADPQLHESGLRALCNWPDATVAPRLIELFHSDKHPGHSALALAALIRIAPLPDKRPDSEKLDLLQKTLALCERDEDKYQVLKRARAIRTVETLRLLVPYLDQPAYAQPACESVVELAHHRALREANKAEFHQALDKVIATSKDATVVDRANRYKNNQTWVRP